MRSTDNGARQRREVSGASSRSGDGPQPCVAVQAHLGHVQVPQIRALGVYSYYYTTLVV